MKSATKPDADNIPGLIFEVVQGVGHGYKDITKGAALAIADYLKSMPAIKHKVQ